MVFYSRSKKRSDISPIVHRGYRKMIVLALFLLLLGLILDLHSTTLIIKNFGLSSERNPLLFATIKNFGFSGLIRAKITGFLIICLIATRSLKKNPRNKKEEDSFKKKSIIFLAIADGSLIYQSFALL